ncbi:MAG TPA: hypothetical protein VGE52_04385, partial [Pirellulales bacterium]
MCVALALIAGCGGPSRPPGKAQEAASGSVGSTADSSPPPIAPTPGGATEATGEGRPAVSAIEGFRRAAPGVFSGGEPKTRGAFAELQKLGVKTIVSVDGAKPNVELAREHQMQYVHIPIGYDGVPQEAQRALVEVMKSRPQPVFIHCHHGKHRGPAAVAVACRAAGLLDAAQAKALMEEAGTSPSYKGLWRDVEGFQPPAADATAVELVEVSEVSPIAGAMAMIDRAFDRLKLAQQAGWKPGAGSKFDPPADALVVAEGFDESLRDPPADRPVNLTRGLTEARQLVEKLQLAIIDDDAAERERVFQAIDASCKSCHKT